MSAAQGKSGAGCCLTRLIIIGALAWGAHWLWEHKHDELLALKERAQEKLTDILTWVQERRNESATAISHAEIPVGDVFRNSDMEALTPETNQKGKAPTPKGDAPWKHAENWTRAKAANLDDLTDNDIAIIENWDAQKPSMVHAVDEINGNLSRIISSPAYSYDSGKLAHLRSEIATVERCIDIGDPLRLEEIVPTMAARAKTFMSSVKWRAGVAHPTAPHVHSGTSVDSWEPDDGYVFSSGTRDDLSVIYRGHAYRCTKCNGSGMVMQKLRCPRCQGKGRVPNPAIQAENAIATGLEIINAFSKKNKPVKVHHMNDPGIQCGTCRGHGIIQQQESCPDCENGTVWR